jgi:VWFA-related protein
MPERRITNLSTLVLGLVLALASPVASQEDDYTFFDTLDVEVVNVEVIVTGPGGEPGRNLSREDFELTEDGKPIEITNFYAVDEDPVEPEAPGQEATTVQVTPPRPADQILHLAVFVDGTTLQPINRRRVFVAVREFFDSQAVQPTNLILASYDGSLEVTQLGRVDPAELDRHLDGLEQVATRGATGEMSRRGILSQLDRASLDPDIAETEAENILGAIQAHAGQQYGQALQSTRALESFVEALAGMPGRKALLYVSGGLPRNPGEALFYAWDNKFGAYARGLGVNVTQQSRQFDTTNELNNLIRHANANRVTFYSVGAGRSGQAGGAVSAEEGSFDLAAMGTSGGGRNWSAGLASIDNANMGSALQEMAAATGGLSMTNSRNFGKLLSNMNRDLGSYYSLGYTPDRERDGKNHRLKVQVRGRDHNVRHRAHYRERTREEGMSGRTRSAVLLGSQQNPLSVALEFGQMAEQKDGLLVPVMVKVPLGKLVLVPQDEVHVGRLGIFICTRDSKGRTSPVQSIDVPIRIPNDQLLTALGQVAGYRMTLLMRPEEHSVAVGVRDELGRVESTVTDLWHPPAPTS